MRWFDWGFAQKIGGTAKILDNKGFDLWAGDYDAQVGLSDESNEYPFAGYKEILGRIYSEIMSKGPCKVLDIGVGTATLAVKLHQAGHEVIGIDFSQEMLKIAAQKMPGARLLRHDFTLGFPSELDGEKFDFIVTTYALHHLEDSAKLAFIKEAMEHLAHDGTLLIGDISFETAEAQNKCRTDCGDGWDDDEFYMSWDDFAKSLALPRNADYCQISHCGGILRIH